MAAILKMLKLQQPHSAWCWWNLVSRILLAL